MDNQANFKAPLVVAKLPPRVNLNSGKVETIDEIALYIQDIQEGVTTPEWRTYSYTAWNNYNQKVTHYKGNSYTGTQWGSVVTDIGNINTFSDLLMGSSTNFGTIKVPDFFIPGPYAMNKADPGRNFPFGSDNIPA